MLNVICLLKICMSTNPLFFIFKEECVVLVQRLFDSYRWLHLDNGEMDNNNYFDFSPYIKESLPTSFSTSDEPDYINHRTMLNISSLLSPFATQQQSIIIHNIYSQIYRENDVIVIKTKDGKNLGTINLEIFLYDFIQYQLNRWNHQQETVPTTLFFIYPTYFSKESIELLERCGKKCNVSSVFLYPLSSFLSFEKGSCLYLDLSPSCLSITHFSDYSSLTIQQQVSLPLITSTNPYQILSHYIIHSIQEANQNLPEDELSILQQSISIQLQQGFFHASFKSSLLHEPSTVHSQPLFSINLPYHYFHRHIFPITLELLSQAFTSDSSFQEFLLHSLQSFDHSLPLFLDGCFSWITSFQETLQSSFSSFTFCKPLFERMNHITTTINTQYPVICNDFCFVDHNISVSIQDGFAMILVKRNNPLPITAEGSLFFSISTHSSLSVCLYRGDSFRQEENAPLVDIPLQYTPEQQSKGGVEVHFSVEILKNCNLIFMVNDTFGHVISIGLPARDYFNAICTILPQVFYQPPQAPICSRLTHSYYQGEMKDGKAEGFGRLYDVHNQLKYEGMWKDGQFHGKGAYYYENGNVYEGSFNKNHLANQGVLYDRLGIVIQQGYFDNIPIDPTDLQPKDSLILPEYKVQHILPETIATDKKTYRYEGERKHGIPSGYGIYYDEKGQKVYEGLFVDGKYQGEGTLYYDNGQIKCKGIFMKGQLNGFGHLYSSQGNLQMKGNFVNDQLQGMNLLLNYIIR